MASTCWNCHSTLRNGTCPSCDAHSLFRTPPSQPDPKRPCDTHGISGCERCFGWCDHGAPDPKDALTTARLEEALTLTRALVAERDQLRARVGELEAELSILTNPSDGRCMEIGALRVWFKKLETERDAARAECERLKAALMLREVPRKALAVTAAREALDAWGAGGKKGPDHD